MKREEGGKVGDNEGWDLKFNQNPVFLEVWNMKGGGKKERKIGGLIVNKTVSYKYFVNMVIFFMVFMYTYIDISNKINNLTQLISNNCIEKNIDVNGSGLSLSLSLFFFIYMLLL